MVPEKQVHFGRKVILVVEDSMLIRRMVRDLLLESDFDVQVACTGAQALRFMELQEPDLVLLDLQLPDAHGLELLPAMKAKHPNMPVILLTGNRDLNDKVRGLRMGASDYVTKPYVPEELLARVDVHLRLADRYRQVEEANVAANWNCGPMDGIAFGYA